MALPTTNYLEAVRQSCHACVNASPVKISDDGIRQFLENLDKGQFEELSVDSPMRMPLKFSTTAEELNFIALIDILNFGSGYRVPLHDMTGRGAFDTIRFGAMSFHIGGTPLTADTFANMTAYQVGEIFQIPIDQEVHPPDMPYVTLTEPSPLKPFAEGIASVLKSTGEFLKAHGYKDLASFILDVTKPQKDQKPSAANLVEQLVKALPGLRDSYTVDGQPVYIYKKAQILVYHLWLFFHDQDHARFDFADIQDLTVFADNVIPTLLIHLGILEIPEAWQQDIDAHRDFGETRTTILRAAAIVACERIVQYTRQDPLPHGSVSNMTEGDLDVYLWRLGKEGNYRKLPRIALRDTVMF